MKAEDVMTRNVHSVSPDLPVDEVAKFMLARKISAVPVLDGSGHLIGMISEGDLMRRAELGTEKERSWWLRLFVGTDYQAHEFVKSHGRKARDIMTRKVVTANADTPIAEIVSLLEENRIKRVPVVRDGRVIGIVSRANLLRAFASNKMAKAATLADSDRDIQARLLVALEKQPWWHKRACNVVVSDGIVHLWGSTESAEEREAIRVTAENTSGVRGVKNHLNVVLPMSMMPG
jgi:CBS domain-containing protein